MREMNVSEMDALEGGIDYECLSWAAVGGAIGSLGGPAGVIGGAIIGYSACTTIKTV